MSALPSTSDRDGTSPTRLDRAREVLLALMHSISRHAGQKAGFGSDDTESLAVELAHTLEELGPTYVKLGQTLSCREDLLPETYVTALGRLQGQVVPMPWEDASRVIGESLDAPVDTIFASIDPEPIGSASLGQVHRGRLLDGRDVAIKVLRIGAREQVEQDLELLTTVASGVDRAGLLGERLAVGAVVETFAAAMRLELDFRVEAANLRKMRLNVGAFRDLVVPRPLDELTTPDVLVMDYMEGTPLADLAGPIPGGRPLADAICRAYLQQILRDGFFHADPHQGNIVLLADGRLAILDLGLVETLSRRDQRSMSHMVAGLVDGAAEVVHEALETLSEPTHHYDPDGLALGIQRVVRRAQALRGIEPTLGHTTQELLACCTRFGLRPPAQLSTLARTLAMLDAVVCKLDPTFDPAMVVREHAASFARGQLFADLDGPGGLARGLRMAQLAQRAPHHLGRVLEKLADGKLTVSVDAIDEDAILLNIQKIANRIAGSVIVAALLMAGAWLARLPTVGILGLSVHSVLLLGLGFAGAVMLLTSILWIDR